MSEALDRLTASIGSLVAAVALETQTLTTIAQEVRDAASAANDDPALNALADRTDAAAASIANALAGVQDVLPPPAPTGDAGTGDATQQAGDAGTGDATQQAGDDTGATDVVQQP